MKLASLKQHPFLFRPPLRFVSRPSAEAGPFLLTSDCFALRPVPLALTWSVLALRLVPFLLAGSYSFGHIAAYPSLNPSCWLRTVLALRLVPFLLAETCSFGRITPYPSPNSSCRLRTGSDPRPLLYTWVVLMLIPIPFLPTWICSYTKASLFLPRWNLLLRMYRRLPRAVHSFLLGTTLTLKSVPSPAVLSLLLHWSSSLPSLESALLIGGIVGWDFLIAKS